MYGTTLGSTDEDCALMACAREKGLEEQEEVELEVHDVDGDHDDTGEVPQQLLWFHLPVDIQYHIVDFLIDSPDILGMLEMLSKRGIRPNQYHYMNSCRYIYLDQCVKKSMDRDVWGGRYYQI